MKVHTATSYEWEFDQLIKLRKRQPELIEIAFHRTVEENREIKWSVIIGAYQDGQINLGKAAELLDLPEIELRQQFLTLGIPLRLGAENFAEARAEVESVRAWFVNTPHEVQT